MMRPLPFIVVALLMPAIGGAAPSPAVSPFAPGATGDRSAFAPGATADRSAAQGAPPPAASQAPAQPEPAPPSPPASASAPGATADRSAGQGQAKPSPLEPQGYTYDPQGRRDPFISLVRSGSDPLGSSASSRAPGLAGLATSEVSLRGTITGRDGQFVGILLGVDNKTYLVRPGDKLLDGTVRTVTEDTVIILQSVNDPLSLDTQREVRKVLRQTEEAKE